MLDPHAFDAMLNEMGQRVLWRRAFDCPCRDQRSGAADPKCPSCRGLGTIWDDPEQAVVAIAGQKVQQEWARLGIWKSGDQVVSIPTDSPAFAAGNSDRMIMADSSTPFSMVVRANTKMRDRVIRVERATCRVGQDIVRIDPPKVAEDGTLVWDSTPPAEMIALTGRAHPEYFAFQDYPQDRAHFGGTLFPRRVVLRKFDLFGR